MFSIPWRGSVIEADNKYESVRESGNESDTTIRDTINKTPWKRGPSHYLRLWGMLLLFATAAVSGAVGIAWEKRDGIAIMLNQDTLQPFVQLRAPLSCGNSTDQAKALGCVYDVLAGNWLHKDCPRDYHDNHLYYQNGTPWTYYKDREGRQPMTLDELADNGDYWSSTMEHLVHCSFLLKRAFDVMARAGRLDNLTGSHKHANHCAEYLREHLGQPDEILQEIHTYGTIGFLTC